MDYGRMQVEKGSWRDIQFGCCASREDVVDEGRVALKENAASDMQICYEQPRSVPQPCANPTPARPSTSQSMSRHVSQWVSSSREYAARASFSTIARPRRSHSRPSISRPSDFRHFDGLDDIPSMTNDSAMPVRRRRSFRPLELSIYVPGGCGRLSPLPDFDVDECWARLPAELERPAEAHVRVRDSRTSSVSSNPSTSSYLIERKPVGSGHSRHSSVQSQKSMTTHERRLSGTTMGTMTTPTIGSLPENTQISSDNPMVPEKPTIQRSRTSGTLSPARVLSRLPSPSRSRANTAPTRPPSLRRLKTDNVDDAIRELNTIVEERRASAYRSHTQSPALTSRPPPSPSHHVPYIAPSMRMRVRSETLSDIGSAFSAPAARQRGLSLAPPPGPGPLTSNPITPPPPLTPTTPIARLGAWLKRSTSTLSLSRPTTPKTPASASPFYKCDPNPLPIRPCTSGSSTPHHTRQESTDTGTVTLYSMSSSRSSTSTTTTTPNNIAAITPPPKKKRTPKPLTLVHEKEIEAEAHLWSPATTTTTTMRYAKPPLSPHAGLLRGMEICAGGREGAVGVAF